MFSIIEKIAEFERRGYELTKRRDDLMNQFEVAKAVHAIYIMNGDDELEEKLYKELCRIENEVDKLAQDWQNLLNDELRFRKEIESL